MEVVSHGGLRLVAVAVASSAEVLEKTDARTEVVGIDEAQFFDAGIVDVALAPRGPRQARDRRGPRPGLSRAPVRADARAHGRRRGGHEDARDLRALRRARQPHAAPRRRRTNASSWAPPASTRRAAGAASSPESRPERNLSISRGRRRLRQALDLEAVCRDPQRICGFPCELECAKTRVRAVLRGLHQSCTGFCAAAQTLATFTAVCR